MNRAPNLDFARDRRRSASWRQALYAGLAFAFSVQLGVGVWQFQALHSEQAVLKDQMRQLGSRSKVSTAAQWSADDAKLGLSLQAMLSALAIPWDTLLGAIEAARLQPVVIFSVLPKAEDGTVVISLGAPDFASVANFMERLAKQDALSDISLVSEAEPENAKGTLRAVVSARWQPKP